MSVQLLTWSPSAQSILKHWIGVVFMFNVQKKTKKPSHVIRLQKSSVPNYCFNLNVFRKKGDKY